MKKTAEFYARGLNGLDEIGKRPRITLQTAEDCVGAYDADGLIPMLSKFVTLTIETHAGDEVVRVDVAVHSLSVALATFVR